MTILNRYIRNTLFKNYLLVSVLLLGLIGFIDLAVQLDEVGKGGYSTRAAVLFTLYHLPRRLVEMFPFTILLGAVWTLGAMATQRELVVMRSSGLSPLRITASVAAAGALLLAAIAVIEIYVAPALQQRAFALRTSAIAGNAGNSESSLWTKSNQGVVYIADLRHGRIPAGVEIFHLGDQQRLDLYLKAETADIIDPQRWRLHNVTRKRLSADPPTSERLDTLEWRPILSPEQLRILDRPAQSLSIIDLSRYVRYLRQQGQNAQRFSLALWQKLALPLTALAMILLAAPLSFANARGANLGLRMAAGAGIGLAVFTFTQVAANVGLLFSINPALLTVFPSALLAVAALLWLRRLS